MARGLGTAAAAVGLAAIAAVEVAYGLVAAPLAGGAVAVDPSLPPIVAGIRGLGGVVVFVGVPIVAGGLTGLAAVGVATGHEVGWWLGVVGSALWLATGCCPVAVVALAILFAPGVRPVRAIPAGSR